MKLGRLVTKAATRVVPGGPVTRRVVKSAVVPALAHFGPSVLVLGQWLPAKPALRALPGDLCRWRGPATGRSEVALTFDDGPDAEGSLEVAELLEEAGMRGTFFTLGERVEASPDVVLDLARRGHEVATHGYTHARHLFERAGDTVSDLGRAVKALEDRGLRPRFFRPPYGQASAGSLAAARKAGLKTVLWSTWGREWAEQSPERVAERVGRRLFPGAIVLLHDSDAASPAGTAARARAALPAILAELDRKGLKSVTLSDLVKP
jgi:peptidoglycan/xylan/chitin deacetylase (PgdA/CDA1 family)